MNTAILKPGKEKPLTKKHPWVFSGALSAVASLAAKASAEEAAKPGETVKIVSSQGQFLAWAGYSPMSQISLRVWSWNESDKIDPAFFKKKFINAIEWRRDALQCVSTRKQSNACRLINAESDGIPGLIVDQYDDVLVMQCLTAGAEYWKQIWAEILMDLTGVKSVYERSDADVRQMEGLEIRNGLLRGKEIGGAIEIKENGLKFLVDIFNGHKTGFYLDQRENREILRAFAEDREVLNCFCYTGGFSVYALDGGAKSVTSVDSSADAIDLAKQNMALNKLPEKKCEWVCADVFQILREYDNAGRKFDLIILDPPKFASNQRQIEGALRGYKDINRLAFQLLKPNGILFTFSCSGGVTEADFQRAVAWGALDAGKEAKIIKRLSQATDHPVALNFPEAGYLKGFVIFSP